MHLATFLSLDIADKLAAFAQFAFVLGIMVIVHELGHFLVAKACGVRVEAFAVGFGKRLFGIVHNGTDYRLNLFPVGGYVKMAGMELTGSAPTDDPGEYQNHPRWQRTLITLAGPVFNFVLAFFLLLGLYMGHHEVANYSIAAVTADYVTENSVVAQTGMRTGDKLVHFDTVENPNFEDVYNRSRLNLNGTVAFSYLHDGTRVDSKIFVENKGREEDFDPFKIGLIPVMQPGPVRVESFPDPTAPAARAGLERGDSILKLDNISPHSVQATIAYLDDKKGAPAVLVIQRAGQSAPLTIPITPALADTREGKAYRLGFAPIPPPVTYNKLSFKDAARESYESNVKNSRLILDVLQRLFTRQVSVKSLSSPIGMGVQVHEAFNTHDLNTVIGIMAMISLNLGIFNLLPIPILDGGMILFLFIEAVIRRDVSPELKERVFQVAFVCILLFAAVVIFNDLTKIFTPHIKT